MEAMDIVCACATGTAQDENGESTRIRVFHKRPDECKVPKTCGGGRTTHLIPAMTCPNCLPQHVRDAKELQERMERAGRARTGQRADPAPAKPASKSSRRRGSRAEP